MATLKNLPPPATSKPPTHNLPRLRSRLNLIQRKPFVNESFSSFSLGLPAVSLFFLDGKKRVAR